MKHLGDITKINGAEVLPVNVVIGGSPCQDLSVAGKRAGLAGERSGLFMEQLRVIKEMRKRDADNGRTGKDIRPRFMVWENVPGAFSSNRGNDFGAVLQETIKVVCEEAPAVSVPKNGWPTAGCLSGGGLGRRWSVAWRVFDAQFWGTPQRRRRIALVADFGGFCAPEILFERESLSGDSASCVQPWKAITRDPQYRVESNDRTVESDGCLTPWDVQSRRVYEETGKWPALYSGEGGGHGYVMQEKSYCLQGNGIDRKDSAGCNGKGCAEDVGYTLNTIDRHAVAYGICSYASNAMKSGNPHSGIYEADSSRTLDLNGGNPTCNQGGVAVCEPICDEVAHTLKAKANCQYREDSETYICVPHAYDMTHANDVIRDSGEITQTLQGRMGTGGNQIPITVEPIGADIYNGTVTGALSASLATATGQGAANTGSTVIEPQCKAVDCRNATISDTNGTMQAKANGGFSLNCNQTVMQKIIRWIVRRLTPMECERLQGYPDGWTDIGEWKDSKGKLHKAADSPRYKAIGNSIALPSWAWVLQRLTLACGAENTMASLFDGIGGFPLIWEHFNGKGSCLWASEIEEFPIAVTKQHFS